MGNICVLCVSSRAKKHIEQRANRLQILRFIQLGATVVNKRRALPMLCIMICVVKLNNFFSIVHYSNVRSDNTDYEKPKKIRANIE